MQWSPAGSARWGSPGNAPSGAAGSGSILEENSAENHESNVKNAEIPSGVVLGDWGPTAEPLPTGAPSLPPELPVPRRNLGVDSAARI